MVIDGHAAVVPVHMRTGCKSSALHDGAPHVVVAGSTAHAPLEAAPAATEQATQGPPLQARSQQTPFAQKLLAH